MASFFAQRTFEMFSKLELFALKTLIPNLIYKNTSKSMLNVRKGAVSMGVWWLACKCLRSLGSHKHKLQSLSLDVEGLIYSQTGVKVTVCCGFGDGDSL